MTLVVRYDREKDYVESILTGDVSASELQEETIQTVALGGENNCIRYLSNFSKATLRFSELDVFELPELQEEQGLSRSIRVAVATSPSKAVKELADFYETVCHNRGWRAKVFSKRQRALDWLLK